MAESDSLRSVTPANSYKDIIHLNNSGDGADSTSRNMFDGDGNQLPLQLSTTKVEGDWGDGLLDNVVLRDYKKRFNDIGTVSTTTLQVGLNAGNVQLATLGSNVTTVTFLNLPSSDDYYELTLLLKQDGSGGRTVTGWPSGTIWPGGSAPTITSAANSVDIIKIATPDAGTIWYAYRVAADLR